LPGTEAFKFLPVASLPRPLRPTIHSHYLRSIATLLHFGFARKSPRPSLTQAWQLAVVKLSAELDGDCESKGFYKRDWLLPSRLEFL
jgi:hypothetical protein